MCVCVCVCRVKETERGERGVSAEAAARCDVTCGRDRVPAGHAPSPPAHRSLRDSPSFVVWRELSTSGKINLDAKGLRDLYENLKETWFAAAEPPQTIEKPSRLCRTFTKNSFHTLQIKCP